MLDFNWGKADSGDKVKVCPSLVKPRHEFL